MDDFSRFSWIYFMQTKDELPKIFSLFKSQVESLLQTTIKVLRTEGGSEYKPILRAHRQITHQTICSYTPKQNGTVERKHRHIVELALTIMSHASIPLQFWDDIFQSVVFLVNRLPPPPSYLTVHQTFSMSTRLSIFLHSWLLVLSSSLSL